jgi:hypothetical protein
MTAGIAADNELDINISFKARQIVKGDNATKENTAEESKNSSVAAESKDEIWIYSMPHHVINATKGPSENVTTAKIQKFYAKKG